MNTSEYYQARARFFSMAFGGAKGYVCLATLNSEMKGFREAFFEWPSDGTTFMRLVDAYGMDHNIYFCPQLFTRPVRKKEHAISTPALWADLDTCNPDKLKVKPSIIVESSKDRFQALWLLQDPIDPVEAEELSKRIAYFHKDDGADISGWDLTQLLRVPFTANHKYDPPQLIRAIESNDYQYMAEDFDVYPPATATSALDIEYPTELPKATAKEVLYKYRMTIHPGSTDLFETTPEDGQWSQRLWSLMMQCFEAAMSREEVFIVAEASACNKFRRDNREPKYLWKDVVRAFFQHEHNLQVATVPPEEEEPLLSDEERTWAENAEPGWVERYIEWARNLGDAAHQYHQASAFIALSSLLSGTVSLPTSFGVVSPNMWFMILADTTLTRKTTSMDLGMSVIEEVNDEILLATDGSLEGLFQGLSARPGKPSVFLRDEFTGLMEAMTKKDYMAGFAEMLTKLYDGKQQKRVLRRETISVKDPILIVYAGGIKSRMQLLLDPEHVASGFLPRFVFITAESDINKIKPMGPPTTRNLSARAAVVDELRQIFEWYNRKEEQYIGDRKVLTNRNRVFMAELTQDAWIRYNQLESTLMKIGMASVSPDMYTPLYDRLGKSILKASILIAAARQRDDQVVIDVQDIVRATRYGEGWRAYAKEIIADVGISKDERKLNSVMLTIVRKGGCLRSVLMQAHHLQAKEADWILQTLFERGEIVRVRQHRGEMIHPAVNASLVEGKHV